jgi:hypothetical protein
VLLGEHGAEGAAPNQTGRRQLVKLEERVAGKEQGGWILKCRQAV